MTRRLAFFALLAALLALPALAGERHQARPLLGGGLSWGEEHKLGAHLFTGVQFPRNEYGHRWQIQVGADYQKHDDVNTTCTIYCWTKPVRVEAPGPLKFVISGVIIF